MNEKKEKESKLLLIPKTEKYIEYMLQVIFKLPRIEKYSIGTEFKTSMYQMLRLILLLNKKGKKDKIDILNQIDSELNVQRVYLRIMKRNHWIDIKKFNIAMEQIYEMGKLLGGLLKYYAKNSA